MELDSGSAPAPTPPGPLTRIVRSVWARVVITLVLLAVVASQLDWGQMADRLRDGQPLDFVAAVLLVVAALAIGAYRWAVLLDRAGVTVAWGRLARIYAVSTFSNTFLPTSVGGDVTRALLVARRGPLLRRAATTILVDRVGGLLGLVVLAWGALVLQPTAVPGGAKTFLTIVTVALIGGTVLAMVVAGRSAPGLARRVPQRFRTSASEVRSVIADLCRDPRAMALVLVTSVVFQGLVAAQLVMLARAIDVDLLFSTAAVSLTLVTIVTLIPISVGGFGLREGSYVVLLGGASVGASDATLISVLTVVVLLFAGLPGAFLMARGNVGAMPQPSVL